MLQPAVELHCSMKPLHLLATTYLCTCLTVRHATAAGSLPQDIDVLQCDIALYMCATQQSLLPWHGIMMPCAISVMQCLSAEACSVMADKLFLSQRIQYAGKILQTQYITKGHGLPAKTSAAARCHSMSQSQRHNMCASCLASILPQSKRACMPVQNCQ